MLVTSINAPSAVLIMLIASLALRIPTSKPRICDVIREAIANPAASSEALLIRCPVDSLSIAVFIARVFFTKAFCATDAFTFVLTTATLIPL